MLLFSLTQDLMLLGVISYSQAKASLELRMLCYHSPRTGVYGCRPLHSSLSFLSLRSLPSLSPSPPFFLTLLSFLFPALLEIKPRAVCALASALPLSGMASPHLLHPTQGQGDAANTRLGGDRECVFLAQTHNEEELTDQHPSSSSGG